MDVEQRLMIKSAGRQLTQRHVHLGQVSIIQQELAIVVMHSLKHTHAPLEFYQGPHVFKLLPQVGSVHHGIVYQELPVGEEQICIPIHVPMEEV